MGRAALIIVDEQEDFCEGGALASSSDTLSLLEPLQPSIEGGGRGDYLHPGLASIESHFVSNPSRGHCVAETSGAGLMAPLRPKTGDLTIHKGVEGPGRGGSSGWDWQWKLEKIVYARAQSKPQSGSGLRS